MSPPLPESRRLLIEAAGLVQGVGFRPFVWRAAVDLGLSGFVANEGGRVRIEAEGPPGALAAFLRQLRRTPPLHTRVDRLSCVRLQALGSEGFEIAASGPTDNSGHSLLPDLATCPACRQELFDPGNRRYRYPFITCTACGPRYSIVETLPWDRERTTMRRFPMCPSCAAEYRNPSDRRFHAETIACPRCGPQLALWRPDGTTICAGHEALAEASESIRAGRILGLKGLGGFQLLVDARNAGAVDRLRALKRRPRKPLALMVATVESAASLCRISELERTALVSSAAPIVLLNRRPEATIAAGVAPTSPRLGVMLPSTPLHHLLLRDLGFPVVATSGNLSDESIVAEETEASERLGSVADLFLVHDRPIARPIDDSVVQAVEGGVMIIRHARGFAPTSIALERPLPPILAAGGHLKSSVAVGAGHLAILGPHIGDLGSARTARTYAAAVRDLPRLADVRPERIVSDPHANYDSTGLASQTGLPMRHVQHHAAHVYACMAEHRIERPMLGIAWDGTGWGDDGSVWGGEFILVGREGSRRIGSLRSFRLPGGEAAVREPRRSALGLLHAALGEELWAREDLPPLRAFSRAERDVVAQMLRRGLNAPACSSIGRMFDAVASLLDLCHVSAFEAEAAGLVEALAEQSTDDAAYPHSWESGEPDRLDWRPILRGVMDDLAAERDKARVAARFHAALASVAVAAAERFGMNCVALAGGCFQNRCLLGLCVQRLRNAGFQVYWPQKVPPNDGGLALGQLAAAADDLRQEDGHVPGCPR